jgi:hypothetical protein
MPEPEVQEIVDINPTASTSSSAADSSALAEKAIVAMSLELAAQAIDPRRKARSPDSGLKFGWWPDTMKKGYVQCIFYMKVIPSGIKRFKQHLAGGFGDTTKCARVTELVSKEMHVYLRKNTKVVINLDPKVKREMKMLLNQVTRPSTSKQRRKLRLQ